MRGPLFCPPQVPVSPSTLGAGSRRQGLGTPSLHLLPPAWGSEYPSGPLAFLGQPRRLPHATQGQPPRLPLGHVGRPGRRALRSLIPPPPSPAYPSPRPNPTTAVPSVPVLGQHPGRRPSLCALLGGGRKAQIHLGACSRPVSLSFPCLIYSSSQ